MQNLPPPQTRGGGELKNNAKFWNPTITPSGRNVCGMESNKKKNRRKIKYLIIKGKKYNNGCGTDQGNLEYITRALNPNHLNQSRLTHLVCFI